MREKSIFLLGLFLSSLFLLGLAGFLPLVPIQDDQALVAANPSGTNVIITEVLYDTPGCDSTCEWVELYNPTSSAISLSGWTLSDNVGTNTLPSVTIPAGGYFVFARDAAGFQSLYGFAPDSDAMTLALGNSGDQLTLKDASGNTIDFVAWEGYAPGWDLAVVDSTIRRMSDANLDPIDTDSPSDWESSNSLGDPGAGYGGGGDTTSPLVTITNPSDGSIVSGTVLITCTATDDSGSIAGYQIFIDNSLRSSMNNYSWDTTLESDGTHSIRCEAVDGSNNVGSDQVTVTVSNQPSSSNFQVYFTNPLAGLPWMDKPSLQEGNITAGIIAAIDQATSSVDAALYDIGWQPIIDALVAAHGRGVSVRIVTDSENVDAFQSLINAGIPVTALTSSYLMHDKFFIIDGMTVFTGSWNPTITGTIYNANDLIKISSASVASIYQAEFDQLFAGTSGNKKVDNNEEITTVGGTKVEVYFMPQDDGLSRLLQLIDSANSSIYISMFYLTENGIYDALVRARDRGVLIKAVFDYRGWFNSYSEADDVISWGGGVIDANPGVYHHKFAVFDGKIVWTGSTNWSNSGFNQNDENNIVIHDATVAAHYIRRTEEFYQDAVNYDNSPTQAPRIVTKHYSGWSGENFISWRPRMDGNVPKDTVKSYLVWRWNETLGTYQFLQEVNWATSYYSDADVTTEVTYYYCVSSIAFDGTSSTCSAEFAEVQHTDGTNTQPVLYPPTGHLNNWGTENGIPRPTIRNPADGETVSGWVDIYFTVDDISHVKTWEVYIDGVLRGTGSHFGWDTTAETNGIHVIEVKATDDFGNTGSSSITVTVDNTNHVAPPAPDLSTLKIMTYNIEASGQDPRYIDVLKEENADIVVLIEVGDFDDDGNASLNALLVQLNEYFASTERHYEMTMTYGEGNRFTGIAIFSRFSISSATLIPVVTLDDGTKYDVTHDFLDVVINIGTGQLHVIGAHLKASSGASNELKREKAQEGIINYMDSLGNDSFIIYAGDLNSFSPEDTGSLQPNGNLGYGPVNMTINPLHPHSPLNHSFIDVFRSLNPTDPGYTYHVTPYESRIDYIFVNDLLAGWILSSTTGDTPSADLGSDHYTVDATIDFSSWSDIDTTPPSKVTGLIANPVSSSRIDLSWNANTEPDLDHYNIYRDGILIASVTSTSYSDTGLSAATTYVYEVSAVDVNNNEGLRSDPVSGTTNSPGTSHVLISEVFYDTPGRDSKEEWIELYNPTNSAVDLSGWTLSDNRKTYTIPSGTIIAAGAYIVIARNQNGFFNLYGFNPDISGLTLSLGNRGDQVILKDNSGQEIDFVAWEGYVAGWDITAPTGSSIERNPSSLDTDTVNDWVVTPNNGNPGSSSTMAVAFTDSATPLNDTVSNQLVTGNNGGYDASSRNDANSTRSATTPLSFMSIVVTILGITVLSLVGRGMKRRIVE